MKKKKFLLIALFALAGAAVWWGQNARHPFLYAGTLEATEVDVPSRWGAVLDEVPVREGDTVAVGQPLARLDARDLRLAADLAEKEYRRGLQLHKNGTLPADALDRLRFKQEDTALRLSWATLNSPLQGTVLHRYREPGEWVSPAQKVIGLADLRRLSAYVYVSPPVMARLRLNQTVTAQLPEDGDRAVTGVVEHIRSEAEFTPKNVQTRTERERLVFGVKIAFDNADGALKPGMTVEVTF